MRRRAFNEYMRPAEPEQPRNVRREGIAAWLRGELAHGSVDPSDAIRRGKLHGYTLQEVCSALTGIGGERTAGGRWALPRTPSDNSTMKGNA